MTEIAVTDVREVSGKADHPEVGQLYDVAIKVLKPAFEFAWRINVSGIEHVPDDGPALICPNHTSVLDSFFLPCALPRRITYVGKAEYMDDWKTKYLFPALGMIPIDRSGGNASGAALDAATRVLERGELFGIYPEGTRSRDGRLYKGHTGPARLAFRVDAPIVPAGIRGTRVIMPPEAKVPKMFMPCAITFGRPVEVGRYRDRDDQRLALRQMIDEVMYELRRLSGQEYVDRYSTKKAEALPTEVAHVGNESAGPPDQDQDDDQGEAPRSSAEVLARGPRRRSRTG